MQEWHRILRKVLTHGTPRPDRTGTGTISLFGEQLVFDNRVEFPAVTTKKLAFKTMAAELACFLQGTADIRDFHDMNCHIWDGNMSMESWQNSPYRNGGSDLGRIYGVQWRKWRSPVTRLELHNTPLGVTFTDQIAGLVQDLKTDPHSRRHLVTAYNPGEVRMGCLPPCHVMFQCYVSEGRLDLRVDMRSVDLFLGLPFDVASYAMLQRLLAQQCDFEPGFLTFQLGDTHIYMNHIEAVHTVLARAPFTPPRLALSELATVDNFHPDMAELVNYQHHGAVFGALNV